MKKLFTLSVLMFTLFFAQTAFAVPLTVPQGGTGNNQFGLGLILYGNVSNSVSPIATSSKLKVIGASGNVFESDMNNIFTQASDFSGTTLSNIGVANFSTLNEGWAYINSNKNLTSSTSPTVNWLVATSTSQASILPYASTTALSASSLTSGNCVQASTGGLLTTVASACGGGITGGTAGMLTSWLTSSTLTATSAPTAAYYTATSTTITSTFPKLTVNTVNDGRDAFIISAANATAGNTQNFKIKTTIDANASVNDITLMSPNAAQSQLYIGDSGASWYQTDFTYGGNIIMPSFQLNTNSGIKTISNYAANLYGYYGFQVAGNLHGAGIPACQEGFCDAASLLVIAGKNDSNVNAPALALYGASGQTANLMEFKNNSNTKLSVFTASGGLGVGTSTPFAMLSVQSNDAVTPIFSLSTTTTRTLMEVDTNGHQITGGVAPTCGTGCSTVIGDDRTMRVTTGSGVTAVTVNFSKTYVTTPVCIANEESAGVVVADASSTPSTVVLDLSASLTSKSIGVICQISNNFTY